MFLSLERLAPRSTDRYFYITFVVPFYTQRCLRIINSFITHVFSRAVIDLGVSVLVDIQ